MKTVNSLVLTIILFFFFSINVRAQNDTLPPPGPVNPTLQTDQDVHKMNIVKVNLLSPIFLNFSLQYERVFNQFLSATLTGRYMPESTVPYVNSIYNKIFGSSDPAIEEAFKGMKLTNYALSLGLRFYPGRKGFGKGFYIAPVYRHSWIEMSHLVFVYQSAPDTDESLTFSGNSRANYGGILLGAQWFLGKHLTLDWWFFGPLAGYQNASVSAVSTVPLSPDEQQILKTKLEDWEMPLTKKNVYVDSQGASLDLYGWMFGYNFGLALGVRF